MAVVDRNAVHQLLSAAAPHIRHTDEPAGVAALSIPLTLAAYELYPKLTQADEDALRRAAHLAVPRRHEVTGTQLADGLAALAAPDPDNLSQQATLATLGISLVPGRRVLDVIEVGAARIFVYEQQNGAPFAVDVFRMPRVDEMDDDLVDPCLPGDLILIEQLGDLSVDDIPRMISDAADYLRQLGITSTDSDPDMDEALRRVRVPAAR